MTRFNPCVSNVSIASAERHAHCMVQPTSRRLGKSLDNRSARGADTYFPRGVSLMEMNLWSMW